MKGFANASVREFSEAVTLAEQMRQAGGRASFAGGGSDLLGLVKERIVDPDLVVSLRRVRGHDQIQPLAGGMRIGGLITLDRLSQHALVCRRFTVLAEAAANVATPQIRNVGTLAGNVCQRPWCWYYRNGFDCYKSGGNQCFSVTGENQFHALFGGGPSFIVHPSDTAPALVALDATFHVLGPAGSRQIPASEFFTLPHEQPERENVLGEDELLVAVDVPAAWPLARSTYHKVLDREAWTHAVVSAAVVVEVHEERCRRARIVLGGVAPIPWRVPAAEEALVGQPLTPTVAARVAEIALEDARPLSRNAYKVPLTKGVLERTLTRLGARHSDTGV